MTTVVPADIEINETILARIIDEQFQLRPSRITYLGEGFDMMVYLVDDQWVFRLPRREMAVLCAVTEMRLLPLLAGRLPIQTPNPQFLGAPSHHFPRPFYGHKLIVGEPGSKIILSSEEYNQAAKDLAQFLRALHGINVKDLGLSSTDLPPYCDRADYQVLKSIFDKRYAEMKHVYDLKAFSEKFDEICTAAQAYRKTPAREVLVHGDIYHRHLIFNGHRQLAGVIDWGDSAVGDLVADLGIGYQFFPRQAREIFFATYGVNDDDTLNYARFVGLYYAVVLLWFGHDRNDRDLIRTSLWTFAEI